MSRLNLEPLLNLPDGSYLAISTECSKEGLFSCSVYSVAHLGERTVFRSVVNHLGSQSTCSGAQEQAYNYALRLYPNAAANIKKTALLDLAGAALVRNPMIYPPNGDALLGE